MFEDEIQEIRLAPSPREAGKVNQQLFQNYPEGQALAAQYVQEADALFGAKTPDLRIEHETAQHRIVLLLKLRGLNNREIAKATGFTEPWISQITRQPWFQMRLTKMLSEAADDILTQRIKVEASRSLDTLVEIRDNTSAPAAARATCAINIIDRLLGKPVQKNENTTNVFHVQTKLEDLNRQIEEVEAAERELLTRGATLTKPDPARP